MTIGGTTVTVQTRTTTSRDAYGNDVYSWAGRDVHGCAVYPRAFVEMVQGMDMAIDDLLLLAPAGTQIGAVDRVVFDGSTYEVNGNPFAWQSALTGRPGRVAANLRKVAG